MKHSHRSWQTTSSLKTVSCLFITSHYDLLQLWLTLTTIISYCSACQICTSFTSWRLLWMNGQYNKSYLLFWTSTVKTLSCADYKGITYFRLGMFSKNFWAYQLFLWQLLPQLMVYKIIQNILRDYWRLLNQHLCQAWQKKMVIHGRSAPEFSHMPSCMLLLSLTFFHHQNWHSVHHMRIFLDVFDSHYCICSQKYHCINFIATVHKHFITHAFSSYGQVIMVRPKNHNHSHQALNTYL